MGVEIARTHFALGSLAETRHSLGIRLRALASGDRIDRAARDAAGLAISERLRAAVAGREQGVRNLSDGVSAARVAEGALDESSALVGRLRELTIQASNGTLGDAERGVLQQEADQISAELTRISRTTDFNGRRLLDGSVSGADAIELEDGGGDGAARISLSVGDQSAAALGVEGLDVSDPASLDALDAAVRSLSSARAEIGSTEKRLESSIRNLRTEIEGVSAANSRIRDTDFAAETALLARDQVLTQAGIAVKMQANLQSGVVLKLLGR